jgi:hypothetical protein
MSLLRNWQQIDIKDFKGAWLITEPGDVPLTNAQLSQNVEYWPGYVKTRLGYTKAYALGDIFLSMFNWRAPSFYGQTVYLAYLAASGSTNTGMNLMAVNNGSVTNLYTPAGTPVGAAFATGGYRLFMATYGISPTAFSDFNIIGTDGATVYSNTNVEIINGGLDYAFLNPPTATMSAADASTGIVTAGVHQIVALFTTRNGFTTIPTPQPAFSHTAPGGEQLNVTLTPSGTWSNSWNSVQLAMTQAGGAQFFIIPGSSAVVPRGSSTPIVINVNIDDGTLALDGTDATPYFTKLTGNLNAWFVGAYSNRMFYLALDDVGVNTCYMSNLNDFQTIYQATSVIYLPGQLQMTCAFSLYNTLYLVGPHWTYAVQDNGGEPVTWAAPQLIDSQIGTLSPQGVTVNAAQGIAWVASVAGLYMFSGSAYNLRPISYYQTPDWNRINWSAGRVQVVDNKDRWKVHVLAPLDGATVPNFIMTWDYSQGVDPESVKYSLDSLQDFNPGAMAVVQNVPGTAASAVTYLEEWLGPGDTTANPLVRKALETDPNPYRDVAQPILSTYQTAMLPELAGTIYQHHADQIRIMGNGNVYINVKGVDGQTQWPQAGSYPLTVEEFPGKLYYILYHLINEAASLQLSTSDLDAWFKLSQIQHYYSPYVTNR